MSEFFWITKNALTEGIQQVKGKVAGNRLRVVMNGHIETYTG